jgi:transposase InsO family protein
MVPRRVHSRYRRQLADTASGCQEVLVLGVDDFALRKGHVYGLPRVEEEPGRPAGENRVARLCSQQQIWSVLAKRRGRSRKVGPPVHDDLVQRDVTARRPDQLWLTDITEHPTAEGKLLDSPGTLAPPVPETDDLLRYRAIAVRLG